ncbi:MAG: YitT family protein [Bacteroidales bacterium]
MDLLQKLKAQLPSNKMLLKREIKSYIIITFCLWLYGFALVAFIINSEIVGGGVNGIATLLYYASGKIIPVGTTALVINICLILVGIKILGKGFGMKTIYAIFMLSFAISFFQETLTTPLLADDVFLSAVIGGILTGIAIGTSFNYGGSTGGTDILALIIAKYRNVSPGRVILYADVIIISGAFLIFYYFLDKSVIESFRIVLYGFVVMTIVSYTIDLIVLGAQQSTQLMVFSKKYEAIADMISGDMKRGVTVLHGQGWYTKGNSEVILVVVRKYEMQEVLRKIKDIDPEAFTSITKATGVYGKGFEHIK